MSASHKPRKRTKKAETPPVAESPTAVSAKHASSREARQPSFVLASIFWPARKGTSQWILLPLILMVTGLFRWALSLWGYSGYGVPPMHGDFEAQRHWMEITKHLRTSQWYFYDLQYWGLDYPPLTAYHSWLLGNIGSFFSSEWFALDTSRGIETQDLKLYMRATVLVSEYLVYIPSAVILFRRLGRLWGKSSWDSSVALTAFLMQPATMLIDHAHFQYNTVMQGFILASMSSILAGRLLWTCIFFVAAISFKQMALYFAPVMFAYLLGVCFRPRFRMLQLLTISVTTLLAFAAVLTPLLLGSLYDLYRDSSSSEKLTASPLFEGLTPLVPSRTLGQVYFRMLLLQVTQVVHRMFPFARGLFEDKVANVWCTIHTIYKLNRFSIPILTRASLVATLLAISPACVLIAVAPQKPLIPYAFASCAWGFFLFSFQVHEKSVLLPLLPMTVLLGGEAGLEPDVRAWVGLANSLGVWTTYPLLKRDELRTPYATLSLLWAYLLDLPPVSISLYTSKNKETPALIKIVHLGFYAMMALWHLVEATQSPPSGKPDLWVVTNCIIGTGGFVICYFWCTWTLLLKSRVMNRFFRGKAPEKKSGEDSRKRQLNDSGSKELRSASPSGKVKRKR